MNPQFDLLKQVLTLLFAGHLYKVNMPLMVTQATGDGSILHHPVQQILKPLGQPSVLQASIAGVARVSASSVQAAAETLQPQEPVVQQTMVFQPNVMEKAHLENSANTALVQQPSVSQQQLGTNAEWNQCADSTEKTQHGDLRTTVFTPESSEVCSPAESLANNSSSVLLDVEEQLDIDPQELVQQQVSDDIIDLLITGKSLDDNTVLKDQDSIASSHEVRPFISQPVKIHPLEMVV